MEGLVVSRQGPVFSDIYALQLAGGFVRQHIQQPLIQIPITAQSIITCVADVEAEKIVGQSVGVSVDKEVNQYLSVSRNIEMFTAIQVTKDAEISSLILVSGESIITPKADVSKEYEIGLDGLYVSSDIILQVPLDLSTLTIAWLPGILVEKEVVVGQVSCVAREIEVGCPAIVSTTITIETRTLVAQQVYIQCLMEEEMAEVKPLLMRPNGEYEQMEPFDFINSRNGPRIPITLATGDTEWIALVPAWLSVGLRVAPTFCLPVTNANGSISLISLGV